MNIGHKKNGKKAIFSVIALYFNPIGSNVKVIGQRSSLKVMATCRWKRPHYVIGVKKMKSKIGALEPKRRF